MTKTPETIKKRIAGDKKKILEILLKIPIVQVACEKSGIGRASYYRWRKQDKKFAEMADEVIQKGKHFINDMAESQLINQIKDQNMTAIIFWLKYNHPSYGNKLELTAKIEEQKELTDAQKIQIRQALKLGAILPLDPPYYDKQTKLTKSNK